MIRKSLFFFFLYKIILIPDRATTFVSYAGFTDTVKIFLYNIFIYQNKTPDFFFESFNALPHTLTLWGLNPTPSHQSGISRMMDGD